MFCTRCGTGNPDRAAFCLSCGGPLSGESGPASRQSEQSENGADPESPGESPLSGRESESMEVTPEAAQPDATASDEQLPDALLTSPTTPDGQHSEAAAATSRWRRATGWALVALGLGVAVIALIGLIAAQGGVSTAVANVMGRESGSGAGSTAAVSLEDVIFAPNVVGLPMATAMERLESVGIDPADVTVTSRPSAVSSEIVMDQVPRPGEVVTGSVALVIADPIIVMPDVVGLDADIASVVLQDAGIAPEAVSVSERPFATVPQLVLEQAPRAGSEAPTAVQLIVAGIALAPDLVGMSIDAALTALEEIGAESTLTPVPILDVSPQTIIGQSIPPGSAVAGPVDLSVAAEPPSTPLGDLGGEEWDRCYLGTAEVDDIRHPDTVYCHAREERDAWIVYRLDRSFERLRLNLAILDGSSAASAVVEIRGDGALAQSLGVSRGVSPVVDLQVSNFTTIEILVRGDSAEVALLDARLYEPTPPAP